MSPEQQRRALDLFDAWVECPADERARRLAQLQTAEPELAEAVRRLLAADAATGNALEHPAAHAANALKSQAAEGGRIGDFELRTLFGRGGMGEVWLAERQQDGFTQRVALKLLRPGLDEADLVRRFVQERRMLAELNHPQIARFIDGGTYGGRPWWGTATLDLATDNTQPGVLLALRGNSAAGTGGAIHLDTNMTVSSSRFARLRFIDNSAQSGGALYSAFPHNVSDTEFSGNWAATHGGAIFLAAASYGNRSYQRVSFNANRADSGSGGGIYSDCADFTASDASFHANVAISGRGQSIDALGSATLRHVSVAGHAAEPALRKRYSTACTGRSLRYGNSLIDGACASTLANELVSDGGNQLGMTAGACPALSVDQRQQQASAFGISYASYGGDIPVLGWPSDSLSRPQRNYGLANLCTASDGRGQPRSDGLCDAGAFEQ
ncbi:MAG: hypothetical protein JNL89_07120 [Rhodanobacteraceae bacterium]|nr:hypothetical protein [Rhodanobacteraceae bacterium]